MCCIEAGFIEAGVTGNLKRGQPLLQVTNMALKQKLNAAERPEVVVWKASLKESLRKAAKRHIEVR